MKMDAVGEQKKQERGAHESTHKHTSHTLGVSFSVRTACAPVLLRDEVFESSAQRHRPVMNRTLRGRGGVTEGTGCAGISVEEVGEKIAGYNPIE